MFWNKLPTGHFQITLCLYFKTIESEQNLSYENEFDLEENEHVGGRHFLMNGRAKDLC